MVLRAVQLSLACARAGRGFIGACVWECESVDLSVCVIESACVELRSDALRCAALN